MDSQETDILTHGVFDQSCKGGDDGDDDEGDVDVDVRAMKA